eukprot:m.189926 g.189926  ORF g.189926 m.189926 type:complete len:340 (-) comp21684_c0_seq4:775-1794(-)
MCTRASWGIPLFLQGWRDQARQSHHHYAQSHQQIPHKVVIQGKTQVIGLGPREQIATHPRADHAPSTGKTLSDAIDHAALLREARVVDHDHYSSKRQYHTALHDRKDADHNRKHVGGDNRGRAGCCERLAPWPRRQQVHAGGDGGVQGRGFYSFHQRRHVSVSAVEGAAAVVVELGMGIAVGVVRVERGGRLVLRLRRRGGRDQQAEVRHQKHAGEIQHPRGPVHAQVAVAPHQPRETGNLHDNLQRRRQPHHRANVLRGKVEAAQGLAGDGPQREQLLHGGGNQSQQAVRHSRHPHGPVLQHLHCAAAVLQAGFSIFCGKQRLVRSGRAAGPRALLHH